MTNCVFQGMKDEAVFFTQLSDECVEFGNRSLDSVDTLGYVRIKTDTDTRLLSMGRRALGLYALANNNARPPAAVTRAGSLIWNKTPDPAAESNLQIWDGAGWRGIPLGIGSLLAASHSNQSGDLSATLATSPGAGVYAVEWVLLCTTAGSGAVSLSISWTDEAGSPTLPLFATFPLNTLGRASGTQIIRVSSGNVAYVTASTASGAAKYALYLRMIPLG